MNLHEALDEANLDFEISELKAIMIQGIVSYKIGYEVRYDRLTVIRLSAQKCTVIVNGSGLIVEFCMP